MTPIERQEEELAYREGAGIAVSLRWNRQTGDVRIVVEDGELGESFVLPAAPEQALQVFHHPYAYA
jgi:transketolase N-terminal domain/subunit